jgi:eukaryotic-like serine/threonine-protein kinase
MRPERFQEIEELYHAVRERSAEERAALLAEADPEVRSEVESLLALRSGGAFLERGALENAPQPLAVSTLTDFTLGAVLGPYRIEGKLGQGGMGEVFRAVDTRLSRAVAIKIAQEEFIDRFQREARAISSLNHPNICTLYDVGPNYLVMELVEGETIAARLKRGPLPQNFALLYGAQILAALAEAHEKGIIHRDLKPGNIMIAKSGIKVLDFGLAKSGQDETVTARGMVLGTPAYMAPEQREGKPADARSDIYSFGCVLHEMLTGTRASPQRRRLTSRKLERIVSRCLEENPARRWQCVAELEGQLPGADVSATGSSRHRDATPVASRARSLYWLFAPAALLLAIATWRLWPSPQWRALSPPPLRIEQITAFSDSAVAPALSSDGKMLAFIRGRDTFFGNGQVYFKALPSGDPIELTHDSLLKMSPVFSPDGSRIAYTVVTEASSFDTWTVPTTRGEPRAWLPNAEGLTWTSPQNILFSEIKGGVHMAVVTADVGRTHSRDIYLPPDARGMAHRSFLSPDGKSILVVEMDRGGWLPCRVVPADGGLPGKIAGPAKGQCTYAAWSPDSRWMYFTSNASGSFQIWRQLAAGGAPEQLTFGPTAAEGLAIDPNGRSLITSMGLTQSSVWLHQGNHDRQVSGEGNAGLPTSADGAPSSVFSPDGKKLYYLVDAGIHRGFGGGELWVADLDSGTEQALLPGLQINGYDVSRDGSQIVFASFSADGKSRLWLARTDRRSAPRLLTPGEGEGPVFAGTDKIYFRRPEGNSFFVYELTISSGLLSKAVPDTVIDPPTVSPDGRWVAVPTMHADDVGLGTYRVYSTSDSSSFTLCPYCFVSWTRDARFIFVSFAGDALDMATTKTYVVPLSPGKMFPPLPPQGIASVAVLQKLTGAHFIDTYAFPGPTASTYAYARQSTVRNLYRVYLPQ